MLISVVMHVRRDRSERMLQKDRPAKDGREKELKQIPEMYWTEQRGTEIQVIWGALGVPAQSARGRSGTGPFGAHVDGHGEGRHPARREPHRLHHLRTAQPGLAVTGFWVAGCLPR